MKKPNKLTVMVIVLIAVVAISATAIGQSRRLKVELLDGNVFLNATHVANDSHSTPFGAGGGSGDIEGVTTNDDYLLGGCVSGTCNLAANSTFINNTIMSEVNITKLFQIRVNCSNVYFDTGFGAADICDGNDAAGAGGSQWALPASEWLFNNSNTIDWNETKGNATYIELGDSFGGEVSGTYDNLILGNDALDDQYFDSDADITCTSISGLSADLCDGSDADTQLTEEAVEDFVGGMLGGTETHIAVTYQDASNDIDFVVSDDWWDADGDISPDEISESKIIFATACAAGNHYYLNGNDLACEADDDTQLTEEAVEDFCGSMLGGTETRINVTYDDAGNAINYVVDDMNDDQPDNDGEVPDDIHMVSQTTGSQFYDGINITMGDTNDVSMGFNGVDWWIIFGGTNITINSTGSIMLQGSEGELIVT